MRLPRLRFTVRRTLLAVAFLGNLAGILLTGYFWTHELEAAGTMGFAKVKMYDDSVIFYQHQSDPMVTSAPSTFGLLRVWWPALACTAMTLLTIGAFSLGGTISAGRLSFPRISLRFAMGAVTCMALLAAAWSLLLTQPESGRNIEWRWKTLGALFITTAAISSFAILLLLPESGPTRDDTRRSATGKDPAMRLPRFQLTVLGLMAIVATSAAALWIYIALMRASRQAAIYREQVVALMQDEQRWRESTASLRNIVTGMENVQKLSLKLARNEWDELLLIQYELILQSQKEALRDHEKMADYYRDLAFKYQHLSDFPWESTKSDPPLPRPSRR
jgi:hypothetical protein